MRYGGLTEEEKRAHIQDRRDGHRPAASHRHRERLGHDQQQEPDPDTPEVPAGLLHFRPAEDREQHRKRREEGGQEKPGEPGGRPRAARARPRLRRSLRLERHHQLDFQSPTQGPSPPERVPLPHGVCQGSSPRASGQLTALTPD